MNILVIGGTRFFGIHMVNELLTAGYDVTIATRGKASDSFGDKVKRIFLERTKEESVREALSGTHYDVVIDKIAYCSNDIKYVMDVIDCDKYIYMSSTSVYNPKHINTVEADFDGIENELIWCDRKAFPYEQIKRQAECALWQQYPEKNWIAVRYPFAIGKDDYTKRLLFYVEHTMKSIPMNIDNVDYQMSYIRSDEAGKYYCENDDITKLLKRLSKRMRYGLVTQTSIILYEMGFNNRIVATKVADILDEKYVAGSRKEIVNLIKRDSNIRRKIEGVLQNYPTYFSFKFEEIVYE